MWQERPDLQQNYDLSQLDGRVGLFWWCLLHGFREYGFRFNEDLDGDFRLANDPVPRLTPKSFAPITWLMRAMWAGSDYRTENLRTEQDQFHCLAHIFAHALMDANLGALLTREQAQALKQEDPNTKAPRLFGLIWHCDPELEDRYGSSASKDFHDWCRGQAARDWPILTHPLVGLAVAPKRQKRSGPLRGVNLYGHALGRLGVGEDVRMAAKALDAANIPYVVRDIKAAAVGDEERPEGLKLSETSPFDVNLLCMTGLSTISAALAEGKGLHEGRHTIGMWPWELPEWPAALEQAWDCVDEVWASSRFTFETYDRAGMVPVYHQPMAVVADASEGATRADFGLPADSFLFGFSFDGLSSVSRKNPGAVIAAFQEAFPSGTKGVGLVLKGIRVSADVPSWSQLLQAIDGDSRIHLINESLTRGRLLDLYRALDAFVSLHRSEGFGRNLAEAMLLGKPVIATDYSGNLDFTTDQTAALVPVQLRKVLPGEYPFGAGQSWAEPDTAAAAQIMRTLLEDAAWRERIAVRGQEYVRTHYSPEVVAEAWAKRLRALDLG